MEETCERSRKEGEGKGGGWQPSHLQAYYLGIMSSDRRVTEMSTWFGCHLYFFLELEGFRVEVFGALNKYWTVKN